MDALYPDLPLGSPRPEMLLIPGPSGPLEVLFEEPSSRTFRDPPALAVVCHPHPLYQGTLQNKVVRALARAANRLGAPAVRFNFRGVGASAGAWDEGRGETEDLLAVVGWARRRWPGTALWLAGFSFGSQVALNAAAAAQPAAVVTVAPPVQRLGLQTTPPPGVPWLVVQGEADELVDWHTVRDWVESHAERPAWVSIPGASHFFHGRLTEVQQAVERFLQSTIQ